MFNRQCYNKSYNSGSGGGGGGVGGGGGDGSRGRVNGHPDSDLLSYNRLYKFRPLYCFFQEDQKLLSQGRPNF